MSETTTEEVPAVQVACSVCSWRSSSYAAAGPVWRDVERKNAIEMAMAEANEHAAVHGMKRA